MSISNQKYIIVCGSTSHMLKADGLLKANDIFTELIPTPSEHGEVCSTAIEINEADKSRAEDIITSYKINLKGVYPYKARKLIGLVQKLKDNTLGEQFKKALSKIETGEELNEQDIITLLKAETKGEQDALFAAADSMRKEILGDVVEIRAAIEFSNYCKKNCFYCGIARECSTPERYRMDEDEIMESVHEIHQMGIKTVILQSGEDSYYTTERIINLMKRIKQETKMGITLSLGERSYEDYKAFREAGANNYLLKIETTNKEIFQFIHPDDDFDYRIQCSKWLRELGYANGTGNIIGLPGQTVEDIARDIMFFRQMRFHKIGIGPFVPAKGTPFEKYPKGSVDMTLKTMAVSRLVCKNVFIPATTALASIDPDGQTKALKAGANTIMLVSTPAKYRSNYQIYSDKMLVDLKSAFIAVKESGRKLPKFLKVKPEEVL
jgi:biotin synthase